MANAAEPAVTFSVDPGTTETRPAVVVSGPSGDRWYAYSWQLESGRPTVVITSASMEMTSQPLTFPVADVKVDTFVEMAVTTNSVSTTDGEGFRWRTLARPAGKKLLDYTGQKELLPPDDFDEYWKRAVNQLDAVNANPRITRVPDKDTTTGLLFRVELDSVENTTIAGWCFIPKEAYAAGNPDADVVKQFPAIIYAPGYGGEQRPVDKTKQGYITFSTNPRNHGPSKAFWKSPVEHQLYNITQPEDYYYKLAALDCLQAARFVFGRKEVDTERVGVQGSSQGAYLSVATAMLEPRVKCVVANVIAFSDYPDGMELATSGHQVRLRELMETEKSSETLIRKSAAYTDGANLITRVKVPVQFTMGGVDGVCPYVCGIVLMNRLSKGIDRDFYVEPGAAHENTSLMRKRSDAWLDRWLKAADQDKIQ